MSRLASPTGQAARQRAALLRVLHKAANLASLSAAGVLVDADGGAMVLMNSLKSIAVFTDDNQSWLFLHI